MVKKKTENITFRVTPDLKAALVKLAFKEDRTASNMLERLIKKGIKDYVASHPNLDASFLKMLLAASE